MRRLITSFLIVLFVHFLTGCANPGIAQISSNTYMLSRVDHGGIFGNAAAMKANVLNEANAFAAAKGKVVVPITLNADPGGFGRFASVEFQFKIVDKDDPEAKRTSLVQRADVVIEKNEKINSDVHTKDETSKQADLYTEIMKLDDLRKKGLITNAEFEAQKQKLLAK